MRASLVALSIIFAVGCGSGAAERGLDDVRTDVAGDTASRPDATDGASPADLAVGEDVSDAGVAPDAREEPADVASVPDDVPAEVAFPPDDGSLEGTSLAGIAVRWDEPLDLCPVGPPATTLAEATARTVRVRVPPQARGGLQRAALAVAPLADALVERSPFADDRWRPDAGVPVVRRFDVSDRAAAARLDAALAWDLGPAGTLVEVYSVRRAPGETAPVVVGDTAGEVRFVWEPPDGGASVALGPCDGGAAAVTAAWTLAADGEGGGLSLVRFERLAGDPGEPAADVSLRVALSTPFSVVADLRGPWVQTRAVGADGREEAVVDAGRDLVAYHLSRTNPLYPSPRLELSGVGPDGGSVRLVGVGQARTYAAAHGWRRVDAAHLAEALPPECADGQVFALLSGQATYDFQVLTCPRESDPGLAVVGLVPVAFAADSTVVGELVTAEAVDEGVDDGWPVFSVALADYTVALRVMGPTRFDVSVTDPAGATLASWSGVAGDLAPHLPDDDVVGASDGAGLSVETVRRYAGMGGGMSSLYAPVSLALTFDERTHLVDAWDRLEYTNTHHNDSDTLVGRGDDLVLRWQVAWDEARGRGYRVSAERPGGEVVLPETFLPRD